MKMLENLSFILHLINLFVQFCLKKIKSIGEIISENFIKQIIQFKSISTTTDVIIICEVKKLEYFILINMK